jgi:hypothetical protein
MCALVKWKQSEISCCNERFSVTRRDFLSQEEHFCQRKKFPVTKRNFRSQEEIFGHRKKIPVTGGKNSCHRKKFLSQEQNSVTGRKFQSQEQNSVSDEVHRTNKPTITILTEKHAANSWSSQDSNQPGGKTLCIPLSKWYAKQYKTALVWQHSSLHKGLLIHQCFMWMVVYSVHQTSLIL